MKKKIDFAQNICIICSTMIYMSDNLADVDPLYDNIFILRKIKRKINDYFSKQSKQIEEPQLSLNKVQVTEKIPEYHDQIESMPHVNDIGIFVNRDLTDDEKYSYGYHWLHINFPYARFKIPISNFQWLLDFNWLAYSEKNQGAYCKHCVVFAKTGGVLSQPLRKLLYEAFNAWKKALGVVINMYFRNTLLVFIMLLLLLNQIDSLIFLLKNNLQLSKQSIESMPHVNDIGIFVNRDLTDDEKYSALTKVWVPLATYKFPLCSINEKRGLKFQFQWLLEFNWLAYSEKNQGAYCKHCVVFAKTGGVGSQPLRKLVYEAFNTWKKALEVVFRKHSTCVYHVTSVVKSDQFLNIFTKKQPSIIEAICEDRFGNQPLRKLVYEAFNAWKKALEVVFRKHSTCDYHVTSVVKSDQFLNIFTKKQPSIIEVICENIIPILIFVQKESSNTRKQKKTCPYN
ncbi:zinc finger MYM-type protein 1-like [Aphis craccivora]|uniref:Zinc finger MYM-type protein 1-like n=1 Tax=Aphis craccivora TaxID=307492 RepID=A0A6G0YDA2_APHCR|nr:zinc finger MYM-type protein 1-like [Aphis craccivora]